MRADCLSPRPPSVLTAAERVEIEARHDGALPPEIRRALRHGSGVHADRAEAQAQSRLFDMLARAATGKSAAHRRAQLARPQADAVTSDDPASRELLQHRGTGLVWWRCAQQDGTDPAA